MRIDAEIVGIMVLVERPGIDFPVQEPKVYHRIEDVPSTPLPLPKKEDDEEK